MKCPICGKNTLGEISPKRYFCSECCHEVAINRKRIMAYYPDEEGGLRLAGPVEMVAESYASVHMRRSC